MTNLHQLKIIFERCFDFFLMTNSHKLKLFFACWFVFLMTYVKNIF